MNVPRINVPPVVAPPTVGVGAGGVDGGGDDGDGDGASCVYVVSDRSPPPPVSCKRANRISSGNEADF